MSCSGVAIGDVSEESSQEKLQLPPRWWQALEGGGRMEQREMFVPHLFPSCFPETERSWVPSEQHPTLIAAVEREACSVFSVPHGEDSLAEVGEDVKSMESFPNFALVLGAAGSQRHSRGSCHSTMPAFYNSRRRPRPECCKFKSWLNYRMCSNLPAWTTLGKMALE